jgi:hypothetical protein
MLFNNSRIAATAAMGSALHELRRIPQIAVAVVIIKSVNGGLGCGTCDGQRDYYWAV